ncbi:hypothetical protein AA313_de0209955 [Arthrobotrys entomopaga]|nr:hypothetical protein AA313_de0209955 [Arthrobotrys entomopaga]
MSLFSPPSSPSAPTALDLLPGYNLRKRKADLEPTTTVESPLTKRFRKLNLRNTPPSRVTKRTSSPARNTTTTTTLSNTALAINNNNSAINPYCNNININNDEEAQWNLTPPPFQRPSSPPPAVMEIDDTPHKIYINDLDSSSDESDFDSPNKKGNTNPIIFLSDVEREMSRIPMAVLKASSSSSSNPSTTPEYRKLPTARSGTGSSTDLILYRPPERIMDDNGGASKLIMQAKERIRARNSSGAMDVMSGNTSATTAAAAAAPSIAAGDVMMDQGVGQLGSGFTDSPMSFIPVATMPNNDPDAMVLDDL